MHCGPLAYGKKFNVLSKSTFRKTFECLCYVIEMSVTGIIMGPVPASLKLRCSTVCGVYVTEEKEGKGSDQFFMTVQSQCDRGRRVGGLMEGSVEEVEVPQLCYHAQNRGTFPPRATCKITLTHPEHISSNLSTARATLSGLIL